MGFIKEQEKRLAIRYLRWQYEKRELAPPPQAELEQHAIHIVDEAHRIARSRGRNVILIIKEMVADFQKSKS